MSSSQSDVTPQYPTRAHRLKFHTVVILAILMVVVASTVLLFQNDTFYTIKLGELLLTQGMLPIDTFSIHEGLPYTYPHWLYDIMIYKAYSLGGFFGVYLSTLLFSFVLGLLLYACYLNLYKNLFVTFLVSITIFAMMAHGFTARAQLLTYSLFVLEVFFIEKYLRQGQLRYILGLVVISILIVNLHTATWVLFFILFLPYIAEYILAFFIKTQPIDSDIKLARITIERNDRVRWLIGVFFLCMLTGLVSPIGDTPYTYLYKTYKGISTSYISEHLNMVPAKNIHFLSFVLCTMALLVFTRVKLRLSDLFMLLGLVAMSLMSLRQTSILYLIGGFILCRMATEFFEANNKERVEFYLNKIVTLKGAFFTLLFIVLMMGYKINARIGVDGYDTGYPVKATEFIVQNLDLKKARVYIDYGEGSYLMFNNIKIFIESRADLYTPEFNGKYNVFGDYIDLVMSRKPYYQVFEKNAITHVVLRKTEPLNVLIQYDPNYKVLHEDDKYIVYEVLAYPEIEYKPDPIPEKDAASSAN